MNSISIQLKQLRILPVLVTNDTQQAIRCVTTMADNGLPLVEITLRTPNAIKIVQQVVRACPKVCVGVGTILNPQQLKQAQDAGAAFGISPGITSTLASAAAASAWPYIPGVGSASDVMLALQHGFHVMKLFPQDVIGGVNMAKAWAGPFPQVQLLLNGGVTQESVHELLHLPNVIGVGGSWICPTALVNANNWEQIGKLVRDAVASTK